MSNVAAWVVACCIALTTHAAVVLAFATLLQSGPSPSKSELNLDSGEMLRPRPIGELALGAMVTPVVASMAADPVDESPTDVAARSENPAYVEKGLDVQPQVSVTQKSVYGANSTSQLAATEKSASVGESVTTSSAVRDATLAVHEAASPAVDIAAENVDAAATSGSVPESSTDVAEGGSPVLLPPAGIPAIIRENVTPGVLSAVETIDIIASESAPNVSAETHAAISATASSVTASAETVDQSVVAEDAPSSISSESANRRGSTPVEVSSGSSNRFQTETNDSADAVPDAQLSASPEVQASEPSPHLALVIPRQPKPVPNVQPLAPVDVVRAVSDFAGGSCFLAVALRDAPDRWQITSYGAAASELDAFARHVKDEMPVSVFITSRRLQNAQCAAVSFANAFITKTPGSFTFALDNRRLTADDHLTATISGYRMGWIYILLVDDEGIAHDIARYAAIAGNDVKLNVPIHLKGQGRARTQLLFAISSDRALTLLDLSEPRPLAEIMPLLRGQITASKAHVEVSVADFEVE